MAENENVRIERVGMIAVLTIDRPGAYNALNAVVLTSLADAVTALAADGARAIIITGSGEKAFSAGADLGELEGLDGAAAHRVLAAGQRTMSVIENCPVPVIAAVNGLALGGGFELILACTFAVLADHATLGLPESGLGLIPGYGGTQRLAAVIGRPAAAHAMLTGSRLSAARAYDLGVTPVPPVPSADLLDAARAAAEDIASKGPRAQRAIITALGSSTVATSALELETALAGLATSGDEAREGIAAFREKRPARFDGVVS